MQQGTTTCRHQETHSIYLIFSAKENEIIPSFQNPQEVIKKLQETNNTGQT